MRFTNASGVYGQLIDTAFGRDHIQAAVIARPVFRVEEERLVEAPELEPPAVPHDVPFLSGGIDLFVTGSAWRPAGAPGARLTMEIRVGQSFALGIAVIGDRRWTGGGGKLAPGEPEPFAAMPLTYANAYGGSVETEQGRATCPANPHGKGFYLSAEQAQGQPLPNLEDPERLIARFQDCPEPIATEPYPAEGSLRALNALDLDHEPGKFGIRRIKPTLFNRAHPRMILPPGSAKAGDVVEVTHAAPEGPLRFALPSLELEAHVELEERAWDFPLHLDQVGVLAGERRVFLSYRTVFKYRVVRGERRHATLRRR
jgi:hypothetical protein